MTLEALIAVVGIGVFCLVFTGGLLVVLRSESNR